MKQCPLQRQPVLGTCLRPHKPAGDWRNVGERTQEAESPSPGRKAQGPTQQTEAYMQHFLSFHPLEGGGKESAASLDRGQGFCLALQGLLGIQEPSVGWEIWGLVADVSSGSTNRTR